MGNACASAAADGAWELTPPPAPPGEGADRLGPQPAPALPALLAAAPPPSPKSDAGAPLGRCATLPVPPHRSAGEGSPLLRPAAKGARHSTSFVGGGSGGLDSAEAVAELVAELKQDWLAGQQALDRERRRQELGELLAASRKLARGEVKPPDASRTANRYGVCGELPPFESARHVPVLALINPRSGAGAGSDILDVARRSPYYRDRFFDIIALYRRRERGGVLDVFREELNAAKDRGS
ncbi:unnamed protein product [Prorocentrum cordatum]|uniref:Uncharacterized protein n=1 Tax=Prorocentrum cordatum TaxID=2364126 RepID=A0ABN9SRL3_9DINO|nr:unnamed protein product [Polarella glacialis]